jgi:predicted ATPase/class 3 adenylate cyclase
MTGLPSGTVAFLFTDVAGSTRLWQDHPEAMGPALARHFALLGAAVAAEGGAVFKTVGDAVCAAFPEPSRALAAALAGQRALGAEEWGAWGLPGPLRVRMALHAGEAEPAGGDYFGPPLNRVARLLGAGHGGQVLLSAAAHELARDALPAGAALADLGEHRLKDLYRPERVFQLRHPDLPSAFPPLRTLAGRPNNLPAQPTPLVGREREAAAAVALLGRDDVRLLTLTGPGGTGKTRLGLQVAADLLEAFPDGCWFVDLAPLADPALVPSAIASVLGVREEGGRPLAEALADHLRDKALLLVLDNLEQLLPAAAPGIGGLLAACPGLTVLATSRAPLRLRAEREWPVPPLGLPDRARLPPLDRLTQYAAVRLFAERAQAVRPDFAVTTANAPAVAEICWRLDGLPLAIELAAARVKAFPPEALLRRLERRLGALTGGARDLPLRQQTLRGAIAWSHDLLGEAERVLFRRLAVFAGGATLEAAEAVAGPDGEADVFGALASLVDQSLVRQGEGPGALPEGEPRFSMLETIREYGLEQLERSGEAEEAHERHATFFLALAEAAEGELGGPAQGAWLGRLEDEHANLRAALGWALEREPGTALRLGGALRGFWEARGHLTEGRGWLERALAGGGGAPAELRAKGLRGAGYLAYRQGDYERAVTQFGEGLALNRALGDRAGIANSLTNLGVVAHRRGEPDRAAALYEEGLGLCRELGDRAGIARSLVNLGAVALDRGEPDRAATLLEESLGLARGLGVGDVVLEGLEGLAAVAARAGRPVAATRLLGMADALRGRLGLARWPADQGRHERVAGGVRAALGAEAFAGAHAAGRAVSEEAAVAEALALAGELAGAAPPAGT